MPSRHSPAFLAAIGLFAVSALGLCSHLVAYWLLLSGNIWSRTHCWELVRVFCLLGVVALILIAVGLARLLRKTFRVWWLGAVSWSLVAVATGLWPLAALLPAARRLDNRRAARFAAWGGVAFALSPTLALAGCFWFVSWPMLLAGAAGTALVLAALRALDGGSRPHLALAWAFAAVVLAALATQPALHAKRVGREADAALAELLKAIDPPVDPSTMYPSPDPVPESEDPVAALDSDAIEKERNSLRELEKMLQPKDGVIRRHPLTSEEVAAATAWFASHTNLTTAADAMTTPGYRSCLSGPASFAEAGEQRSPFREPRAFEAYHSAQPLYLRARMTLAVGDAAAGADSLRRLENLATLFDDEPTLIAFLMADAIRSMAFHLISERIDLLSEDGLLALQHAAEEAPAWAESHIRIGLASEAAWCEKMFQLDVPRPLCDGCSLMCGSGALEYWLAFERRVHYRNTLASWEDANRILQMDAGAPLGEETDRFREDYERRLKSLSPLATALSTSLSDIVLGKILSWRDRASFVRAAVAVERFRRANGGALPPSLDALVPDFLAEVPRAARTGAPLAYDPGPIQIPEETFPVLRDPDEAAAEDAAEFRARFGDAGEISEKQLVDAINDGYGQRATETRTLPAMTLPGFRLTFPDRKGRKRREIPTDFLLAAPAADALGSLRSTPGKR